jgi:biopolymer transport protein ExbB
LAFHRSIIYGACTLALVFVGMSHFAAAQPDGADGGASRGGSDSPSAGNSSGTAKGGESEAPEGFVEILIASGWVGLLIVLLSVAAVALMVEQAVATRASVLMPPGLAERVRQQLQGGQITQAVQQCKLQPSVLSFVIQSGLAEIDGKWAAMEKAMEDATAEQAARLHRKIEYLSVIANISTMLGLLGTVLGVIEAFRQLASGESGPANLASGIYLALVTTAQGLIVAIPSLAAYAFFRNKVDHLLSETAYTATHVFSPFKRRKAAPAGRP